MCIVCDRISMIKENRNPYFVRELETGYAVIGDYQHFRGYALFLYKRHVTDLHLLDREEKQKFLEEMSVVAEAAQKAAKADKINIELLGNGDAHLHWHLFPRKAGDLEEYGNHGKGPVWWYPREKMYDDANRPEEADLTALKENLLSELNRLL